MILKTRDRFRFAIATRQRKRLLGRSDSLLHPRKERLDKFEILQ